MFGLDDLFAFPYADVVFCVIVVAMVAATIYVGRTFFKKI